MQKHRTCNLKVDRIQLPHDFALFHTFFCKRLHREWWRHKNVIHATWKWAKLNCTKILHFFVLFFAKDCIASGEDTKSLTCNLKIDKTQLPHEFALFCTFFTEDCIGSGEDVKTLSKQPKTEQASTAPWYSTFLYIFCRIPYQEWWRRKYVVHKT